MCIVHLLRELNQNSSFAVLPALQKERKTKDKTEPGADPGNVARTVYCRKSKLVKENLLGSSSFTSKKILSKENCKGKLVHLNEQKIMTFDLKL